MQFEKDTFQSTYYDRYVVFVCSTSTSFDNVGDPASPSAGFDSIFEDGLAEESGPPPSPTRPSSAAGHEAAAGAAEPGRPPPAEAAKPPKRRKHAVVREDTLEAEIRNTVRGMKATSAHDDYLSILVPLLNRMDEETCARFKLKIFTEATNLAYPTKE